jgi:hypothetical protein
MSKDKIKKNTIRKNRKKLESSTQLIHQICGLDHETRIAS